MSEEIFDIVNDRDEVIGQCPRREVHRLGHKHRAVHVLVFNSRGEVFLQKRSMSKDTHPGVWDSSSSGHLDTGEDYDACAIRELREEIGLVIEKAPQRVFKIDACTETGRNLSGFTNSDQKGRSRCIRRKLSAAIGLRRSMCRSGSRRVLASLRRRLS